MHFYLLQSRSRIENDNAFWDGNRVTYGHGYLYDPVTSLDVVAHEFGHGVMDETANLIYEHESGALDEGFSDIWGACVEHYAAPEKSMWLIAEDVISAGLRSMSNPNAHSQPDTYGGTYWSNPNCGEPTRTNDYCGVHKNSGVLNYWFYLLTDGDDGTNDLGKDYCVSGIGILKSEQIVYRTLNVLLMSNPDATFAETRTATIQAARDLYGINSNEEFQVMNAWYAVGVGFPSYSINYASGPICSSAVSARPSTYFLIN